jgi:hypothetical protein
MSDQASPAPARYSADESREVGSGWVGFMLFAAIMMMTAGVFQFIQGLVAVFQDSFYVTTPNYVFEFDVTVWGWIHMVIGLVVGFAGWGLLTGRSWARWTAIIVAAISALANFMFLPYYPLWSLLIIVLDVLIIYSVATHGRELERMLT